MRAALIALIVPLALLAVQNAGATVPSGLYEGYSPILMAPFGPLDKATAKRVLPRWLEVDTQGQQVTIDFMPDKRVRWILTYGPHGPTQKITEIDGDAWTTSTFTYDAKGHLTTKHVDGPGLSNPIEETILTDANGRRIKKRDKATGHKTWSAAFNPQETVATHWLNKTPTRVDTFDLQGRLKSTAFPSFNAKLTYRRLRNGALKDIRWILPSGKGAAMPLRRDPKINSLHLRALSQSPIERHEALLLLGQPITHSDLGQGDQRAITDDYSPTAGSTSPPPLCSTPLGCSQGRTRRASAVSAWTPLCPSTPYPCLVWTRTGPPVHGSGSTTASTSPPTTGS